MEIYKNPSNVGRMPSPSVSQRGVNEMCGDEMDLFLKIESGVITDAKFESSACSVSVVSSSILTEMLVGENIAQAEEISKEELLSAIGVNLSTSRIKCATLPLETLKKALEKYKSKK